MHCKILKEDQHFSYSAVQKSSILSFLRISLRETKITGVQEWKGGKKHNNIMRDIIQK
jgi:hypothetical protein